MCLLVSETGLVLVVLLLASIAQVAHTVKKFAFASVLLDDNYLLPARVLGMQILSLVNFKALH